MFFFPFLGLDWSNRKLIVVEPKNNEQSLIIDLLTLSVCELKTTNLPDKTDEINFISLNLIEKKDGKRAVEIIFYDQFDLEIRNKMAQMQMAKKWCRYVNRAIVEGND